VQVDLSRRTLRSLVSAPAAAAIARLAATIRRPGEYSGRLLVVGTADYEPWHLVAHLQSRESIGSNVGLIRHTVKPAAPAHLALGLDELARVGRHDVVLFVSPEDPGEQLLQRLVDARRHSSALLALASPHAAELHTALDDAADESVLVEGTRLDGAQHLLSALTIRRPSVRRFQR
jgi:hypothetical protein